MWNMISGATILNESQLYTFLEFFQLMVYALICGYGVYLLVNKVKCMNFNNFVTPANQEYYFKGLSDENCDKIGVCLDKIENDEERQQVQSTIELVLSFFS